MDAILEMRENEPKSVTIELAENTVLGSFFKPSVEPQPKPCGCATRHYSSRTTDEVDDACARKKERMVIEADRRTSSMDEDARQLGHERFLLGRLVPYW